MFITSITVLNFGVMKIFGRTNIEANVRDEISSGKIHDYVGLSEFIQRDDTTQSRFIINVHEGDTFVTHVRVLFVTLICHASMRSFCVRPDHEKFRKFKFKPVITGI